MRFYVSRRVDESKAEYKQILQFSSEHDAKKAIEFLRGKFTMEYIVESSDQKKSSSFTQFDANVR